MNDAQFARLSRRASGFFSSCQLAGILAAGALLGFCAPPLRAQSTSYLLVAKGEVFNQASFSAPVAAASGGALFMVQAPTLGGSPFTTGAQVTLPGGASRNLTISDSGDVYQLVVTNDTIAQIDAAYPPGNYAIAINSTVLPGLGGTVALPADSFPTAPRVSNFTAAQLIDSTQDFTLEFAPFNSTGSSDDASLEVYDGSSLVTSSSVGLTDGNVIIDSSTLDAGKTYEGVLRFRSITIHPSGLSVPASAFFCETRFPLATKSSQPAHTNPPVLSVSYPANGEVSTTPSVLFEFDQPMDESKISIQWHASLNGLETPLDPAHFSYLWSDNKNLLCFYGSFGADWPAGALISWILNPGAGGASNFANLSGQPLAVGAYTGSFLDAGGPWSCVAEEGSPTESPAFYIIKSLNFTQANNAPPATNSLAPAQALAFVEIPEPKAPAGSTPVFPFPILTTAEPVFPAPVYAFTGMPGVTVLRYFFSENFNQGADLDATFTPGRYKLQLDVANAANPGSQPVVTNSVILFVTNAYYPPAPQFTNSAPIPPVSITNGFAIHWLPWAAPAADAIIELQVLDAMSNVVFYAPDSCAGLDLPTAATSVEVPANVLSNNAVYTLVLSFKALSDSGKAMPGNPGFGYAALAAVTRMDLAGYLAGATLPPGPVVAITSPPSGSFVAAGPNSIGVSASQLHGSLASVALFTGTNLLGSANLAQGQAVFNGGIQANLGAGPQFLTVVAIDNFGQTTTTPPLYLMAQGPEFVVNVTSPAPGSTLAPFSLVGVTASAASPHGSITNISLFVDGLPLGTGRTSPATFSYEAIAPGPHQFQAEAFDAGGFGGISEIVTATIATPPPRQIVASITPEGLFSAGIAGMPGAEYVLESATNLAPPAPWTPVLARKSESGFATFLDVTSGPAGSRFYRVVQMDPSGTNSAALAVEAVPDRSVTALGNFEQGVDLSITNQDGYIFTADLTAGAMDLAQDVSLTATAKIQDYPFEGPVLAAATFAPGDYELFVKGTLTIQLPTNIAPNLVAAFSLRSNSGEIYLTRSYTTNIVNGTVTNNAIVIPVYRLGTYGIALLTAADYTLLGGIHPTLAVDSLDQATALAMLRAQGAPVPPEASIRRSVARWRAGRDASPPSHEQLVQQFLDQFDTVYAQMQGAIAAADFPIDQYHAWTSWYDNLEASGLADSFSLQIQQFVQAIVTVYQITITQRIQNADQNHDWNDIVRLIQIDLSGSLHNSVAKLGWGPGAEDAIQEALDKCLQFEFDVDSQMLSETGAGDETSRIKYTVSFAMGNPVMVGHVLGTAPANWVAATFDLQTQCSTPAAAPSTPDFSFFFFNPLGSESRDAKGRKSYNLIGVEVCFWTGTPLENFTMNCDGHVVTLANFWFAEFGYLYSEDLGSFPNDPVKYHVGAQICYRVSDNWSLGAGTGDPVLAERNGSATFELDDDDVTETSSFKLRHTPK